MVWTSSMELTWASLMWVMTSPSWSPQARAGEANPWSVVMSDNPTTRTPWAKSLMPVSYTHLVNVAADPLFTIAYTGVNAGMVICVADDPGMHSSQNEQDSRHYAVSAKLPMLEPADSEEARAFAKRAFQLSEEYDTPVFLKLCTRIAHSQSIVELGEREEVPAKPYEKNIAKYVICLLYTSPPSPPAAIHPAPPARSPG